MSISASVYNLNDVTPAGSGITGSEGITGPAGSAGVIGPAGPAGVTGPVGAVGPTGAAGSVGPTGAAGAAGTVGATGAAGAQGITGPAGPSSSGGSAILTNAGAPSVSTYSSSTGQLYIDTTARIGYWYDSIAKGWYNLTTGVLGFYAAPASSMSTAAVTTAGTPYLWLDAADASKMALSGSTVTSWTDKSPNARSFVSVTPPSVVSYKGANVVSFSGLQTLYVTNVNNFFTSTSSGATFFLVFKSTNNNNGNSNLLTYRTESDGAGQGYLPFVIGYDIGTNTDAGNFGIRYKNTYDTSTGPGTVALGSGTNNPAPVLNDIWNVMTVVLSTTGTAPSNVTIYKNGSLLSNIQNIGGGYYSAGSYPMNQPNSTISSQDALYLGAYFNAAWTDGHNGQIAEVIAYQTSLSSASRVSVENYLREKWSI